MTNENSGADKRSQQLDSWKAIAGYLKRDVRTVQRWERQEGLPVRRKLHDKLSSVYALKPELDEWWDKGRAAAVRVDGEPARPRRPLLAVLPLRNLSGNQEEDYFSDGLTEELISQLSCINPEQLGVIARGSTIRYKGVPTDINRIARELGANYILDGSVRRSNNRVRIAVQLVEVSDHGHLWADSYDRELSDILDLQAEVAKAVTAQTSVRLSARAAERLSKVRPVAPEAYEAYLRGRLLWNQRSASSIMKAAGLFERAISIDPDYAPAHAGLVDCYAMLSAMAMGAASPAEMIPKAKAAARRALELDPQLAEAHASLGCIQLFFDWDWPAAHASFDRALKLNPNYPPGRQWYAEYLATLGRVPEAIDELARAQEIDPLSLTIPEALAAMHYYARDFDRAIYYSQRTLDADPNFALAYLNLGRAYVQKRLYRQAIAVLGDARERFPDATTVLMTLGHAYACAGKKEQAQGIIGKLRSIARRRYVPAFHFAAIYTALGDFGQAFTWLAKARQERCDYLVYLDREPGADPLRSDPRFLALIPRPPAN